MNEDGSPAFQSVNSASLAPVLTRGVQAALAQNAVLAKQNAALMETVAALSARVAVLEAKPSSQ